jgi:hypothetical protein
MSGYLARVGVDLSTALKTGVAAGTTPSSVRRNVISSMSDASFRIDPFLDALPGSAVDIDTASVDSDLLGMCRQLKFAPQTRPFVDAFVMVLDAIQGEALRRIRSDGVAARVAAPFSERVHSSSDAELGGTAYETSGVGEGEGMRVCLNRNVRLPAVLVTETDLSIVHLAGMILAP